MELYIWLYIVDKIIGTTCPFTSKFPGVPLTWLSMIASWVFIALTFFFANHWYHGIILLLIEWLLPLLIPKTDPNSGGIGLWIYSMIFSHLSPVLVILMYLSLFNVI